MPLSHTVGSSVIRNQNHSLWEFCPDQIENALSKIFLPVILPPWGDEGQRCRFQGRGAHKVYSYKIPEGDSGKSCPPLFLFFLLELNQIPRLTLQKSADCVQSLPRHKFSSPKLLKIRLTDQLLFTNARGRVALFLQFCQNIYFVADCHKMRLLFHCPYSITGMH